MICNEMRVSQEKKERKKLILKYYSEIRMKKKLKGVEGGQIGVRNQHNFFVTYQIPPLKYFQ